jgi:Uma2 family endonuclease
MSTAIERYQFTVADYERMVTIGIFDEDDRVELLGGEIVTMSPVGHKHIQAVNVLGHMLYTVAGPDLTNSIQNPIQLGPHDEPQPDLAVLRGGNRGLAEASEVLLVIEVADSSREYDRAAKLPRYAAAGIPEAWLIDLGAETVERHTEPSDGYYRFAAFAMRGDTLASTVLPALTIPADDVVLGPAEE